MRSHLVWRVQQRGCVIGTYKRLPRGRKKETNEFISFAEKTYVWVLSNWRQAAMGAAIAVVVFGVALGIYRYREWHIHKAEAALSVAQDRDDSGARRDALAAIVHDYGKMAAGREALTLLANDARDTGRTDDAVMWFGLLADHADRYPILKTYALHNLGLLYGKQGKWNEAAASYHEASLIRGNVIASRSLYGEARSLEALGDDSHAIEIYTTLIESDEDVDPQLKAQCKDRVLWLIAHRRAGD